MGVSLPTVNDWTASEDVRWCPGCGDFSVLAQFKKALADLGVARESVALFSGTGCAARLPTFVDAYGFQAARGRAPALATGAKLARPDLQVWVVTGDGEALGPGAGSLLHAIRRNADVKILLLNNEVFGMAKGQYSPASRVGTRTASSAEGSFETPLRPLVLALAAEATFVARTMDVDVDHLAETLQRAAQHRGAALVEVWQNCKVFNDGVFEFAADPASRHDNVLYLEQGKPLVYGRDRNRAIRLSGLRPEATTFANGTPPAGTLFHDESADDPTQASLLARMAGPDLPECLGVFRCVSRPTYEETLIEQTASAVRRSARPGLAAALLGDASWTVE